MKILTLTHRMARLAMAAWILSAGVAFGQVTFNVSNTNYQYYINGTNNTGTGLGTMGGLVTNNSPPLFVTAGTTNLFVISVEAIHPVKIVTNTPGPLATTYSGASPQGLTSGTMTLIVPATNYPSTLFYECSRHFFYGTITVLPPTAGVPPRNTIISLVVTPNGITVTSTGTNTTYTLVPEFSSNLLGNTWLSVPTFTNTFTNGTNTTSFDRLDAECGSNVFLRISQRP